MRQLGTGGAFGMRAAGSKLHVLSLKVAVLRVYLELVSSINSLFTGKKQGIFANLPQEQGILKPERGTGFLAGGVGRDQGYKI